MAEPEECGFEVLFRSHSPAVYRYAYKAVHGDSALAEDIVQQVFLAVWRQYTRDFENATAQHALQLIMKIAGRRVIDTYRRGRRNGVTVSLDSAGSTAIDRAFVEQPLRTDPAERVLGADRLHRFWIVLSRKLTGTEYQVALLAWDVGLADEEIAKTLGHSVSTVWSHKCRARRKIKDFLGGAGEEGEVTK